MNTHETTITSTGKKNPTPGPSLSSVDDSSVNPYEGAEKTIILVVEQAVQLEPLRHNLEAKGYPVLGAYNSNEALRILKETAPKLIILNLSLGCSDDWQLLRAIRRWSDVPIIGLVDADNVTGINEGLQLGIDDYVSRSVDSAELDLRIRIVLLHSERSRRRIVPNERRSGVDRRKSPLGRRKTDVQKTRLAEASPCLTAGPFKIDDRYKIVTVEGEERWLSPKEYTLLKLLVAVPGRVVSNEEIIASLWPHSSRTATNNVQRYMHLLRRKVEKDPKKPRWIKTVKGFGYRLTLDDAK